ncbi:hypothetical protein Q7469_03775 [Glaesserella parasuis]|uniref:hypothetical protein n=1 Tax=Glaesserella parasuis TaxID=738 RepID=UPI00094F7E7E|nr:hypothetical protein [Glaesserella parasuis]MDG6345263.1 hypothetical protein [Glaesserella parasuis]MDG6770846.1 hypothetical protein [Glaesserella parasuis]MDO9872789.1 hypothetical protein [Glaesserella parasuis]MDO9912878.1 hypothetical protein [Glaesserella parasuis]MDP0349845.1 hypothetical protein [Glaesserella parasuis]
MKKLLTSITLLSSLSAYAEPTYLLFAGENHDKFLGCLNCNKYDNSSIWNKYGDFGSKYSSESIWNKYGTYGSKYSGESPWNKYSTEAPVIVDSSGNYYGKFTINKYDDQTRIKSILWILENHEYIMENLDDIISKM